LAESRPTCSGRSAIKFLDGINVFLWLELPTHTTSEGISVRIGNGNPRRREAATSALRFG
jgi:hypothetical protein